jgi:hypothetical protein
MVCLYPGGENAAEGNMKQILVVLSLLVVMGCSTHKELYQPEKEKDRSADNYEKQYVH